MKNSKWFILLAFAVGILAGSNTSAISDITGQKIAIIDINAVVGKSAQVKALKEEQVRKNKELAKWIEVVNADIKKQSKEENKQKLLKKYNEDLAKKKDANAKDFAKKSKAIEQNITALIKQHADSNGYIVVLNKNAVVYGGDDITEAISKIVK